MCTVEIPDKTYELETRVGVELFEEFQEGKKKNTRTPELLISSELETKA